MAKGKTWCFYCYLQQECVKVDKIQLFPLWCNISPSCVRSVLINRGPVLKELNPFHHPAVVPCKNCLHISAFFVLFSIPSRNWANICSIYLLSEFHASVRPVKSLFQIFKNTCMELRIYISLISLTCTRLKAAKFKNPFYIKVMDDNASVLGKTSGCNLQLQVLAFTLSDVNQHNPGLCCR